MCNLKSYTGKELVRILEEIGFDIIRIKGSHFFMKHPNGRSTVVPVHANETIGIGLFLKILRDVEISKEDFMKL